MTTSKAIYNNFKNYHPISKDEKRITFDIPEHLEGRNMVKFLEDIWEKRESMQDGLGKLSIKSLTKRLYCVHCVLRRFFPKKVALKI